MKNVINKRLPLTLVAAAVLTLNAAAQTTAKPGRANGDTLEIDRVHVRVMYHAKVVRDTLTSPYAYRDDEMYLDIGVQGVSRFYSHTNVVRDSLMRQRVERGIALGGIDLTGLPKSGAIGWTLYKNYPQDGHTLLLESIGQTPYQCDEPGESPQWELVPDSTASVLGYPCQLAVARFKGRTWSAWYAEDIPLSEGPWKLCDLPGLVLRAYDAQRQYEFEAVGLRQFSEQTEPVLFIKEDRESVTQKKLRKLNERYDPLAEVQARHGMKVVKIVDENGNDIKRITRKLNPIERE